MFDLLDYDYDLPEHLIAQAPAKRRDQSQLLVVDRFRRAFSDHRFFDLPKLLKPGDLLVVNNTRVVPARLFGKKESGGRVELLVLDHPPPGAAGGGPRLCLLKSSKRPRKGSRLLFEMDLSAVVEGREPDGRYRVRFEGREPLDTYLEHHGTVPLPPYIRREERDDRSGIDRERYQTIFSKVRGAVAAPTAGLHFTDEIRQGLAGAGVRMAEITLHVGYGTFQPVRARDIREHKLGEEECHIDGPAVEELRLAKQEGRRVVAVGTTVVRALESMMGRAGAIVPFRGRTGLLITPGFRFGIVDGLITNFHLPRSSLLFLVSALAGRDLVMEAYGHAIRNGYRFYSYGDAMLIL